MHFISRSIALLALTMALCGQALAETAELRITKQPSIIYLPLVVMEQNKLLEKRAKAGGPPRRDDRGHQRRCRGQQPLLGAALSIHRVEDAGCASGARLKRRVRRSGEQCGGLRHPQVL